MSSIVVAGDTSGSVTLSAPAVAGTVVITLPSASGTMTAFAAGTALIFRQTAAPTGWTKVTASGDNSALRVVTGTAGTGGSVAFTTAFASQAVAGTNGASGAFTLATTNIPAHLHAYSGGTSVGGSSYPFMHQSDTPVTQNTQNTGGGSSHSHSAASFTGTAINLAVAYVDVIVATKD